MTIIQRYLTREILKYFCLVMAAAVGIYIAIDFIEKVDDFLEHQVPLTRMLTYFALKLPEIAAQIAPVSVLLSVLIVFGLMNRHNEILVLTSSGVSIYSLVRPVIALGVVFSIFVMIVSEVALPFTAPRLNRFWREKVKGVSAVTVKQSNIWLRSGGAIIHIRHYDPESGTLHGVAVNNFDAGFNLVRRLDAAEAVYRDDRWVFTDVMEQIRDPRDGGYRIRLEESKTERFEFLPADFASISKRSQDMSFLELSDYVQAIQDEGYDATRYRVDLIAKTALPPVCIIFSILAVGIAARRKARESLAVSIAAGLLAVFLYWVVYSFSLSLGYGGIIPPLLAAWVPNFICLCLGAVVLLHVERAA